MKYILLILIFFCNSINMQAQQNTYEINGEHWQKEIAGKYGHLDGIALFEDGSFILYGYATLVYGAYVKENNYLKFTSEKMDTIRVFAHHNPSLKDQSQLLFSNFEDGDNYVKIDTGMIYPVFNKDANCFDGTFIYQHPTSLNSVTLWNRPDGDHHKHASWQFSNVAMYNTFILIFNRPRREYEDFVGSFFKDENDNLRIQLSNYGGERGYQKSREDSDDNRKDWEEMMDYKKMVEESITSEGDYFMNKQFHTFHDVNLSLYTYDEKSNDYRKIDQEENSAYYEANSYADDRILRKLSPIKLDYSEKRPLAQKVIANSSIFYTSCEEPEKSYQNPFKVKMEPETRLLEAIPPIPIPTQKR